MTSSKMLSTAAAGRENNLNAVKFVAAAMVIVSHAYAFAGNYSKKDWFSLLTGQNGDLGALAVYIFFFYSGLLITMSLFRNGELKRYIKRRAIRIYPAYFAVTVLIVFVAAPIISNISYKEYFLNKETYLYLKNLIFLTEHNLPGVFVDNIYARSVNGPIWTVRVEVACYVFCYVLYRCKLLKKEKILPLILVYLIPIGAMAALYLLGKTEIYAVVMPFTMYFMGMLYAVYSDCIKLNKTGLIIGITGFMLLSLFGLVIPAGIVFLPIVLCNLAFGSTSRLSFLNGFGSYSYEMYLWGGFVGQTVTYMFGGSMNEYVNMLITLPAAIILGYLTEKATECMLSHTPGSNSV